jgi:thiocyanate hydrolase subunit beta
MWPFGVNLTHDLHLLKLIEVGRPIGADLYIGIPEARRPSDHFTSLASQTTKTPRSPIRQKKVMKMASRPELRQQYELIGSIQPALHVPQNWNYENSAPLFRALMHPPHDVGGQPDVPVYYEEKEEEQWELDTYVTCEVLGWRGVWTAEERRRRADNDLGYTLYLGMPYYGRWIWSAARMLVDKKHITLTELLDKIAEVKSRHEKK